MACRREDETGVSEMEDLDGALRVAVPLAIAVWIIRSAIRRRNRRQAEQTRRSAEREEKDNGDNGTMGDSHLFVGDPVE